MCHNSRLSKYLETNACLVQFCHSVFWWKQWRPGKKGVFYVCPQQELQSAQILCDWCSYHHLTQVILIPSVTYMTLESTDSLLILALDFWFYWLDWSLFLLQWIVRRKNLSPCVLQHLQFNLNPAMKQKWDLWKAWYHRACGIYTPSASIHNG